MARQKNVEVPVEEATETRPCIEEGNVATNWWDRYNEMKIELFLENIGTHKQLQEKALKVIDNILTENISPKTQVQQQMLETAIKLYEAFK